MVYDQSVSLALMYVGVLAQTAIWTFLLNMNGRLLCLNLFACRIIYARLPVLK